MRTNNISDNTEQQWRMCLFTYAHKSSCSDKLIKHADLNICGTHIRFMPLALAN